MNPRVILAASIVFGTAVALAAYDHTMSDDQSGKTARRTFAKVVVVGGVVSAAVLYMTSASTPRVSQEPFPSTNSFPAPQPPAPGGGGTMPLPAQ
jgi:hypothetical protein